MCFGDYCCDITILQAFLQCFSLFRDAICSNNFPDVMLTNIYNYHELKDKQSCMRGKLGALNWPEMCVQRYVALK